ncbi:serine hydrolase domain-containing protein [Jhaorihella thermophila]
MAEWLPYFTPALPDGRVPDITVRQLMTHTSGLSYPFFEPDADPSIYGHLPAGLERSEGTLEDAMRTIAGAPLFYEPGTEWRYSVSTDVLGAVIEAASGMTLPDAIDRYVTGPLGMSETAFVAVDAERLATAYRDGPARAERLDDGDMIPVGVSVWPSRTLDPSAWPSGGGGMSGTARDYLRFLEAIRNGGAPILSEESAKMLTSHQIGDLRALSEGPGWGHGLGAAVLLDPEAAGSPQSEGTWAWGGVLGTHWFVDPAEDLTVLVMTNTSVAGVIGAFPAEFRDAVYGVDALSTN